MPASKKPKLYNLQCEWAQCKEQFKLMDVYCQHVEVHMLEFLESAEKLTNGEEGVACQWRDCTSLQVRDYEDLVRHVYNHTFHSKLKSVGQVFLEDNMWKCDLDTSTRNIIPEVQENFVCSWQDCQLSFDNPESFYNHIGFHTDNAIITDRICKWKECNLKPRVLKGHLRKHTHEALIACPGCGHIFTRKDCLKSHIKKQAKALEEFRPQNYKPLEEKSYDLPCEWQKCEEQFDKMTEYCNHLNKHLQDVQSEMEGNGSASCEWRDCLNSHMRTYGDLVRHVYFHGFHTKLKCVGQRHLDKRKLQCSMNRDNRNTVADVPENFSCKWQGCNEQFDNPHVFYKHVADHVIKGKNNQTCLWEECGISFKFARWLKLHISTHTDEGIVACPTCGIKYKGDVRKLEDHVLRQSEVKNFECSTCDMKFATKYYLRRHIRRVHGQGIKCPQCDRSFKSDNEFKSHFASRHQNKRPYLCTICDKSFKLAISLKQHIRWRHSDFKISCKVEGCTFKCKSQQQLHHHHRKDHEGLAIPKYRCHLCHSLQKRSTALVRHLSTKHNFKFPPGYKRLKYTLHEDGHNRIDGIQYDYQELTDQATRMLKQEWTDTTAQSDRPKQLFKSAKRKFSSSEEEEEYLSEESICSQTSPTKRLDAALHEDIAVPSPRKLPRRTAHTRALEKIAQVVADIDEEEIDTEELEKDITSRINYENDESSSKGSKLSASTIVHEKDKEQNKKPKKKKVPTATLR